MCMSSYIYMHMLFKAVATDLDEKYYKQPCALPGHGMEFVSVLISWTGLDLNMHVHKKFHHNFEVHN